MQIASFEADRLLKARETIAMLRGSQHSHVAGATDVQREASASTSHSNANLHAQLREAGQVLSNTRLQAATHPYEITVYVGTPFTLKRRQRALQGAISDLPPRDEEPHPHTLSPRIVLSSLVSQPLTAEGPTAQRALSFQTSCQRESMAIDGAVRFIGEEPAPALLLSHASAGKQGSNQAARSVSWKDFAGPAADRDSDSLFTTVTVGVVPAAASHSSSSMSSGSAGTGVDHGSGTLAAGGAQQGVSTSASASASSASSAQSSSTSSRRGQAGRQYYEAVGRVLAQDLCAAQSSTTAAFPAVKPCLSAPTVSLLASLHACRAGLGRLEHGRQVWNTRLAREPLAAGLGAPGRMNREYAVY